MVTFLLGFTVFHKVNIYFEWGIILLISFLFYKNGIKKAALKNILFFAVFSLLIPNLDRARGGHHERDMGKVREESGDLLLQVVFVASLAREHGDFDMRDVVRTICDKLIRRHPHVFGDVEARDSDAVLRNWESIKLEERRARKEDLSVLAGVPAGLPPLLKAHRMQGKAAHVGFDWPGGDAAPLFAKLDEEADELWEAVEHGDAAAVEDELGDLLFMAVNLARHLGVNPDAALS